MAFLSKAISSVSQYYKEINPSTLSGAIDVIVVERTEEDGQGSSQTVLACSPWHVRFGKLSVLRPSDRIVNIRINGSESPYPMKIGDTGEAYFVFETDEQVPEDLLTSPLAKPVSENDIGDGKTLLQTADSEPELLDLGPQIDTDDQVNVMSDQLDSSRIDDGETSETTNGKTGAIQNTLISTGAIVAAPVYAISHAIEEITQAMGTMNEDDAEGEPRQERTGSSSDLMLDMSGYKIKQEDTKKAHAIESHYLKQEFSTDNEQSIADDLLTFTQALLRSADLSKSRAGATQLEELKSATASRPVSPSPRDPSRASSPAPSIIESTSAISPIYSVSSSSAHLLALFADGAEHIFELALCPFKNDEDETLDEQAFDDHRITYTDFADKSDLVTERNLVVKYRGRYLTWDNASPVLAALSIYSNAMAMMKTQSEEPSSPRTSDAKPNKGSTGRSWGRWWSRSKLEQAAADAESLPMQGEKSAVRSRSPSPARSALSYDEKEDTDPASLSDASTKATSVQSTLPSTEPKRYAKTLRLTSEQLKQLNLHKGTNTVSFSVASSYSSNTIKCTSRIFLWESHTKICISDIDGTITKSDALGHVFTMIGRDWTHLGVAKLYTDIARNGYKMLYLTSRAIGQADTTREYLKGIQQNGYALPDGPVIMSPDRLMTSLHREVIMRKPEVFKMACLQDIQRLFAGRPFFAGFGNRITDALSYRSVDIPSSRIFTIDSTGDIKLELLALAGYKSSYIAMNDLVDQMFPPVKASTQSEYSDFHYWRTPIVAVDLPDLTPPSPVPSAYSIRRITQSISRRSSKSDLAQLQQQSRAASPRPTSPLANPSMAVYEEPEDLALGLPLAANVHERERAKSLPSSFKEQSVLDDVKRPDLFKYSGSAEVHSRLTTPSELEAQTAEDDSISMDDLDEEMDFSSVPF